MDDFLAVAIPVAFATFVAAHVALVAGLLARPPRARALVAAAVLPLAPYWGARLGMRVRAAFWTAGALAYLVLRIAARG
jgi:hypothetical protein